MSYEKIGWQNSPETSTPLNATNLNHMDDGILNANQKAMFGASVAFTADGVLKTTVDVTSLGGGSFTSQTDIVTAFVCNKVISIDSGAFVGCTALKTIYIDNTSENVTISSGAIPDTVTIVYSDDENFINVNDLLVKSIKNLNDKVVAEDKQHKSDIEDLQANKVNTTDFEAYKITNDTAVSKNATDIVQLNTDVMQNAIKPTTDKSTNAVVNDSSDKSILGLSMYGNSTQSAVPTPTDPVGIVSVSNPSVSLYGKNILDFEVFSKILNHNTTATVITTNQNQKTVSYNTVNNNNLSGVYFRWKGLNIKNLNGCTVTISLDVTATSDCTFYLTLENYDSSTNKSSKISIKANQTEPISITTTYRSDVCKALSFYTLKSETNITLSNIQIEVNSTATEYTSYVGTQDVTISDVVIRSIGEIQDTITINSDGTGYLTQNLLYERIKSGKSSSGQAWGYSTTSGRFYRDDKRYQANFGTPKIMCSHFEAKYNETDTTLDNTIGFTSGTGKGIAIRMTEQNGDISAFESWLDENEVYILVPLAEPIVTELAKDEVDKILALHTYYPTTTILSDCDCQLTCIADTKLYIDNKFNDLANAIIASASSEEVM